MQRDNEFTIATQKRALVRQNFSCGSCGEKIFKLGEEGRSLHKFGEIAHAHHVQHIKFGGTNLLHNCVIICQACHYSAHEGGRYRFGTVVGNISDFPYYNG